MNGSKNESPAQPATQATLCEQAPLAAQAPSGGGGGGVNPLGSDWGRDGALAELERVCGEKGIRIIKTDTLSKNYIFLPNLNTLILISKCNEKELRAFIKYVITTQNFNTEI